jgi:hypothetical protein
MPKTTLGENLLQALVAVLAGNVAYFLLMPHLPVIARHVLFSEDPGLVVDFFFCLVMLGIVKLVWVRLRTTRR